MKQVLLPNGGTVLEKADRISREEIATEPPDNEKAMTEAINYAIRSNALEGLITSQETLEMMNRVKAGELTFDDMRRAIDYKARALSTGDKLTLAEAYEAIKRT